jgi:quinoprotein dehydrogenase-associated probable ABC transporter substrate-binding protein
MSLPFRSRLVALSAVGLLLTAAVPPPPRLLRVCADPNNLPFSNRRQQGFENRIAALVAADLHATLVYTWWAQRRGFVRNTLNAGRCDLVMGVPVDEEMVRTTHPYYASTYVFLTRRSDSLDIHSLDDPRLRRLRIGIHFIGDDYHNTPPAQALARRGLVRNVTGYSIYGDYSKPNPPARLIDAVARGDADVAIVWGPFAGYFGRRSPVPLAIAPVPPEPDSVGSRVPFVFRIAAGVRRSDTALQARVDRVLGARRSDIREILGRYGVPLAGKERT